MAELKTKPTDADVDAFIAAIEDPNKRADAEAVMALMTEIVGAPAKLWGASMIGFGSYDYRYASGREGSWFVAGFSPRKKNLTLYVMAGFAEYESLMNRLGKHKVGKSCLYINKLADVDLVVLRELVAASVAYMRETYPPDPQK